MSYKLGRMDQTEKISRSQAEKKALEEYREYNKVQPIVSDFDKFNLQKLLIVFYPTSTS